LVPIDALARRFGLRASTIRYYESYGLLEPASRHGGRRWYSPEGVRRLAVIRYWQECGLIGLAEIARLLDAGPADGSWRTVMEGQVATLAARIEAMTAARAFLEHLLEHHDCAPDGCEHYEESIWANAAAVGPGGRRRTRAPGAAATISAS
jgi:DNA-binding transcriptional MerR regulator